MIGWTEKKGNNPINARRYTRVGTMGTFDKT